MAYANFKQTFWSKHIQSDIEKKLILAEFCNREFEGEVKYGNKVKILGVGDVTIKDYTGSDIDGAETPADGSVFMLIDQSKYFNFKVDDVDKAQSKPGLLEAYMKRASYGMKKQMDSFIASKAVDAGAFSSSTQVATAAAAKTAIDAGILALTENDVDPTDIVIELSPFVYMLLRDKYVELDRNNSEMIKKGFMGRYAGTRVRLCNNLYNDGTDDYCMLRTDAAIAFAQQINMVEAYRPEKSFSDAVKGLAEFGAKVVRPKELYVIKAHK